jgi:5,6-dimethylbenzimidazole synthase
VTDSPFRFSDAERAAVYRAIAERRDMRHFKPEPLDAATLERLLNAAHCAPSVGLMQPWRFVRVTDRELRQQIHALVEEERQRTAEALGSRQDDFLKLKVQGVLECGELLIAALCDGREKHVFGRRTLPQMDLASVACAIQNLWLAARAEGIGMGWVSIFDPTALARLLDMPDGSLPIAILCLGHVDAFYPAPMLELTGWAKARPLHELMFLDRWNNTSDAQNLTTISAP